MGKKVLIYIVLIALSLFYLFPIYTLLNTSLKTDEDLKYGPVAPRTVSFSGPIRTPSTLLRSSS